MSIRLTRGHELAGHVSALGALVSDQSRLSCDWSDRHHILHRGAALRAGRMSIVSSFVGHDTLAPSLELLARLSMLLKVTWCRDVGSESDSPTSASGNPGPHIPYGCTAAPCPRCLADDAKRLPPLRCHRGQSTAKTRVNALSFPRIPIRAKMIEVAGTSPATTRSVWLDTSGNSTNLVVPEQCQQNDDWNWNAQQPQKYSSAKAHVRSPWFSSTVNFRDEREPPGFDLRGETFSGSRHSSSPHSFARLP